MRSSVYNVFTTYGVYLIIGSCYIVDYGLWAIYELYIYNVIHSTNPLVPICLLYLVMLWLDLCIYKMFKTYRTEHTFHWSLLFTPALYFLRHTPHQRIFVVCFFAGLFFLGVAIIYASIWPIVRTSITAAAYFVTCTALLYFDIMEEDIRHAWWQYLLTPGFPLYDAMNFMTTRYETSLRTFLLAR